MGVGPESGSDGDGGGLASRGGGGGGGMVRSGGGEFPAANEEGGADAGRGLSGAEAAECGGDGAEFFLE